jgi:hypothetical protein
MNDDSSIDAIPAVMFEALRNLLAICADPKRSAETLTALEARAKTAKQAENRLGTVRERASIEAAREAALLDERRATLTKRAHELMVRESMVAEAEKQIERGKIVHRDPAMVATGLTRDFGDGRQTSG